jgi:Kef-type K+ transport system membrane component KefB
MTILAIPPAPISAHQTLLFLVDLAVLLGLAILLGRLAARLGIPAVIGELSTGLLVGPSLLGHLAPGVAHWLVPNDPAQLHLVDAVGQLGVLFLVGVTGMHVDLGLVRRHRTSAAVVSFGSLVVPLVLGVALGLLLPAGVRAPHSPPLVFALFLGVALCLSAIPVIAKTLLDMRLLHRDIGQLTIGTAAVVDVVGWLLLSVVTALATTGARAGGVLLSVAALALTIAVTVTVARPVVNALLATAARHSGPGPSVAVVTLLILLASTATQALRLEAILGAFLVGIVIGSSRSYERERLTPLAVFVANVLAPLFFATAGLRMDLTALRSPAMLGVAVAVIAVAVAGKFIGSYAGARASRLGHWPALALGAGLNARGAVEIVVAAVGLSVGVLTTQMYTVVVLMAIVTSLMAGPCLRFAVRRMPVTATERAREHALVG